MLLITSSFIQKLWYQRGELCCHFHHNLIWWFTTCCRWYSRLDVKNSLHDFSWFLILICDISIFMHTKNFRIFKVGQFLNILLIGLKIGVLRNIIEFRWWKDMFLVIDNILIVVFLENWKQADTIPVICNSASIVDVTSHIEHSIPRIAFILDTQKHF